MAKWREERMRINRKMNNWINSLLTLICLADCNNIYIYNIYIYIDKNNYLLLYVNTIKYISYKIDIALDIVLKIVFL